jgi:hypothetical protein
MIVTAEQAAVKVLRRMELDATIERILAKMYEAIRRFQDKEDTCSPSKRSTPQLAAY